MRHQGSSDRRRSMPITEEDRELLAFAAEHKLVLAAQVKALRGSSLDAAARRLRALQSEGLLWRDRPFAEQASCFQITRPGLGAIESRLPAPKAVDRALYRHDVGVGWLWLAAWAGVWGEPREVVSERRMRSADGSRDARDPSASERRFGIRLGGAGAGGRERLHYPDLLLVDGAGNRIALELELSAKGRTRRETILAGYAADARIDAILYLVDRTEVGASVAGTARSFGIGDLVHVQPVRWGPAAPGRSAGAGRAARHPRARARASPGVDLAGGR